MTTGSLRVVSPSAHQRRCVPSIIGARPCASLKLTADNLQATPRPLESPSVVRCSLPRTTDGSVTGLVSVGSRLLWSGETDTYLGELAVADCASSLVTCAASVLVAIHEVLCYVVWEKVRSVRWELGLIGTCTILVLRRQ